MLVSRNIKCTCNIGLYYIVTVSLKDATYLCSNHQSGYRMDSFRTKREIHVEMNSGANNIVFQHKLGWVHNNMLQSHALTLVAIHWNAKMDSDPVLSLNSYVQASYPKKISISSLVVNSTHGLNQYYEPTFGVCMRVVMEN